MLTVAEVHIPPGHLAHDLWKGLRIWRIDYRRFQVQQIESTIQTDSQILGRRPQTGHIVRVMVRVGKSHACSLERTQVPHRKSDKSNHAA